MPVRLAVSLTVRSGAAIDLTQTIKNGMTVYVGDAVPKVSKYKWLEKDGMNLSMITLGSHTGTHVDAPIHFVKGGKTLDELSVESFVGKAVVIDMSEIPPGTAIEAPHLERHSKSIGRGVIVLLYTGMSKRWEDPRARRNYTYLGTEAAAWLAKKEVKAVGIDYLSVEEFGAKVGSTHYELLSHGIPIIESLNEKLGYLVGRKVLFVCLPIKVGGCDGAPARAMAYVL